MSVHASLHTALVELEAAMKAANMWQSPIPDADAMASQQPFCIDTMAFPQWLRYVFIARLKAMVDAEAAMPAKCEVAPALAAYLKQEGVRASDQLLLIKAVERVDELVTQG